MRLLLVPVLTLATASALDTAALEQARNRQDRAALSRIAADAGAVASKQPQSARAHYEAALALSYSSEVAAEQRDREKARAAAESGIRFAERAVELSGTDSEYRRVLGTLCGQAVPANVLAALRYGRCALDNLNQAIERNPKSSMAYLSRGIGYHYLPAAFGGGVDAALTDIRKAIELNPKSADAHLWLGIVLRKANRNAEARQALAKSVQLNPLRIWAKQQLDKTPAK